MKLKRIAAGVMALAGVAWMATPVIGSAAEDHSSVPHYQHIVEIMMENQAYGTIIGSASAPQINALANTYGLATNYYGVTHPSEPNYMAAIAGDYFGVQDDDQFYCTALLHLSDPLCATSYSPASYPNHTVNAQSIADQLTAAGKTWKGYFQSLPPTPATYVKTGAGANGPYTFKYPSNSVALYASKHNPFINFAGTQNATTNMVPDTQLATDLANNTLPNYGLVVPDQCHDMHGTGGCPSGPALLAAGDAYVGATVSAIMSSETWEHGRNAIVITWDEDDFSDAGQVGTGCCGATIGGGHVVTIVITNKGEHHHTHIVDNTPYNHYSLLRTMEAAFGLSYLGHAGDAAVTPMTPLFTNRD